MIMKPILFISTKCEKIPWKRNQTGAIFPILDPKLSLELTYTPKYNTTDLNIILLTGMATEQKRKVKVTRRSVRII